MRPLTILMPMAGLGSRFAKAGFTTPKPLIEVDGQPMFLKALSSIEAIDAPKQYHFVIRQEHVDTQLLDELIRDALPEAKITVLPEMTRGAAETAYAAVKDMDQRSGLIVMDCDLWFQSKSYDDMVMSSLSDKSEIAGGLITFESSDPRYSYARLNEQNLVIETAEKSVISSHAISGAYFFASVETFSHSAEQLLSLPIDHTMPEYYLSLLYNILIDERAPIQASFIDQYASFGTPEELAAYAHASQ